MLPNIEAYVDRLAPEQVAELLARMERIRLAEIKRDVLGSLYAFVEYFWDVLEPDAKFVGGWVLEAMCLHLDAVTRGEIKRLLINVPPGSGKSIIVNVFWPAWVWARGGSAASTRYLSFSYAIDLTRRDNGGIEGRFSRLLRSTKYRQLFSDAFAVTKDNESKISNDRTGWKIASSIGGVGTGERGDVVILDDPHNVKEGESEAVRTMTVEWFANTMSNRLNSLDDSAIVVIMQRVHEADVSGYIIKKGLPYEHLLIAAYSDGRRCETSIGWVDPREEDGINFWPERYSDEALARLEETMLPFAWAGQYQQIPQPRGGGLIKPDWWRPWNPETAATWSDDVKYPNYPKFDLIVAGLDTAYTEDTQNDPSAMTVWGVTNRLGGATGIFLLSAWHAHLEFHDLLLRVAETCSRWRVDKLLVEGTAAGKPIISELRRTYGKSGWSMSNAPRNTADENWRRDKFDKDGNAIKPQWIATEWSVIEVDAFGKRQLKDSIPKATSIVSMFFDGLVWAPQVWSAERQEWKFTAAAELVIDEGAFFPYGEHDDLLDTAVLVLRYLRDMGMASMAGEASYAAELDATWGGRAPPPIYPGASQ